MEGNRNKHKPTHSMVALSFSGKNTYNKNEQTNKKTNNIQLDIQQALLNVVHQALCNTLDTEKYRRCGFHSFERQQ